ncbi:MAG: hypothetical protein M3422_24980, partial [Actinomycetota bacterium]|nr:hypothetical protein [Actinomycetota bacterium]
MMSPDPVARRCAAALNTIHSTVYFAEELGAEFARRGVTDPMGAYLACRAAPLGAVGPGAVG